MKLILGFNSNYKYNEIPNWSINKHAEVLNYPWEIRFFSALRYIRYVTQFNWKQYVAKLKRCLVVSHQSTGSSTALEPSHFAALILVCEIGISTADVWFIFPCIIRKYNDQWFRTSELGSTHSSVMMCQYLSWCRLVFIAVYC